MKITSLPLSFSYLFIKNIYPKLSILGNQIKLINNINIKNK